MLILAKGIAAIGASISALVLLDRGAHLQFFAHLFPHSETMNASVAVGFIALAAALWLRTSVAPTLQPLATICAALAAVVGSVILLEYFGNTALLGIDRLLVDTSSAPQARPAPNSAVGLLLLGLALFNWRSRRVPLPEIFALFGGLLGMLALLGYSYDVSGLYRIANFTAMSPPTALLLMLFSVAIVSARPDRPLIGLFVSPGIGGLMARRAMPMVLLVPAAFGWLALYGLRQQWYDIEFAVALFATTNIVVFGTLIAVNGFKLRVLDRERNDALAALTAANASLETRVQARTVELESINQELDAFSYSVSHDLRAPLRAIDGFSQALLEDCADRLDDNGRDHLQRVRAAAQRMGHLIDDLLQLSRVSRLELNNEQIDLSRMAVEIAADLDSRNPGRQPEMRIARDLSVRADPRLLRVVLENLLSNAWKFTAERVNPLIEFGVQQLDARRVFYVRDNGVGFDMAHADKLFGAFQRLHDVRRFPGTGIGLATVHRVMRKHGGRVWAEGVVDAGATFYFEL